MNMKSYSLEVTRKNLEQARLVELPDADKVQLADGEALIRVNSFGLTANNITYGVAGDIIGYWQFFPASGEHGRIPVWGIGAVLRAGNTELVEGAEYYGYYPMSSYLVVRPGQISDRGFVDIAEHRTGLPPAYNQYSLMTEANGFDRRHDAHRQVYYPLFVTGFILDDWLADNDFFGAEKIILSSASSKTAFSLAFLLKRNRQCHVIGLTSEQNRKFVQDMGIYDEVATYDEVEQVTKGKAAFVDMAGNPQVRARVHHHFGEDLVCSSGVGVTHWESRSDGKESSLPGARPSMFFAPDQIQKRSKEWGPARLQQEMQRAWSAFLDSVDDWAGIHEARGGDAMLAAYRKVLQGAPPNQSQICFL